MPEIKVPQSQDWNSFWGLSQEKKIKLSWSKKRILKIIAPFIKSQGKAFDAGCGSGFFSKYFCDQGMLTTACDYSQEALRMTKTLTEGRVKELKIDLLSHQLSKEMNESFDLIFSDGLLEHFPGEDQDKIFRNFKSILKDDGTILTFVPNRWSPWEWIRPLYMPGIEEIPFVMKQLIDLNHRNGLRILAKGGINVWPMALSPDKFIGSFCGMLLYTISKRK